MPAELKMQTLRLLDPKEVIRCSAVSRYWHSMCFDGQLWADLNATNFYRDIPAESLVKIIRNAGPFARDLNLRGCVQLWDRWHESNLADACTNLENISLEGCRIDRNSIHCLLYQNARLMHINVAGLAGVTNTSMTIIAQQCPKLEYLNVSWCCNVDTRGLRKVAESCRYLEDLRASEIRGFNDPDLMDVFFQRNSLRRLILMGCDSLTDEALKVLIEGKEPEFDFISGRTMVPTRRLKHLDLSRCRNISDAGLRSMCNLVPSLEGLQVSKCHHITDNSMTMLLPTITRLTHLDLEECSHITNATLLRLAKSNCRLSLQHLNVSYCEHVGDVGMIATIKQCPSLTSLELDNTRISDLVLVEAADNVRNRQALPSCSNDAPADPHRNGIPIPRIGLRLVAYDCQNVTWTGIRAVMLKNVEIRRTALLPKTANSDAVYECAGAVNGPGTQSLSTPALPSAPDNAARLPVTRPQPPVAASSAPLYPQQVIALKVFYGYQPTVTEHTRRVLSGNLAAAARLESKWTEYMMASEEAGAPGGFGLMGGFVGLGALGGLHNRRRRRRAREAAMMHADEENGPEDGGVGGAGAGVVGRRRRARSGGGCAVM